MKHIWAEDTKNRKGMKRQHLHEYGITCWNRLEHVTTHMFHPCITRVLIVSIIICKSNQGKARFAKANLKMLYSVHYSEKSPWCFSLKLREQIKATEFYVNFCSISKLWKLWGDEKRILGLKSQPATYQYLLVTESKVFTKNKDRNRETISYTCHC